MGQNPLDSSGWFCSIAVKLQRYAMERQQQSSRCRRAQCLVLPIASKLCRAGTLCKAEAAKAATHLHHEIQPVIDSCINFGSRGDCSRRQL
jgi:hypothetical protein